MKHPHAPVRAIAAVAVLATLGLAGCLDAFGEERAPSWGTGYAFAYSLEGHASARGTATEDGEVVADVDESEDIGPEDTFFEVLDRDFEIGGEGHYLAAEELDLGFIGAWALGIRHRDLAAVRPTGFSYSSSCTNNACTEDFQFTFGEGADATYLAFPLEKGKSWAVDTDQISGFDMEITSTVEGVQRVDTPLGRMDAILVKTTARPTDLDAIREELEEEIREEGGSLRELHLSAKLDIKTWYAPSVGAVVVEEVTYSQDVRVDATMDGKRLKADFEEDVEVRSAITGMRHVVRPERSDYSIAQVFLGGEVLVDPAGEASGYAGAYGLHLVSDTFHVNVADGEVANLEVHVMDPPLPEGHAIRWEAHDASGNIGGTGTGTKFTAEFDEPGLYLVRAVAVDDDGAPQAGAAAMIVADYVTDVAAGCFLVNALTIPGCSVVAVPVRVGIDELTVSMVGTTGLPMLGTLELSNAYGQSVSSGSGIIHISDFSGWVVDGGDWQLEWNPVAQAVEPGQYRIEVNYGELPGAADAPDGFRFGTALGIRPLERSLEAFMTDAGLPLL